MDRVRNDEVHRRAGIERELASNEMVLHVKRMVLIPEVSGGQVRGRPRLGWMDGVKALGNREMMVQAAHQWAKEWRALVRM